MDAKEKLLPLTPDLKELFSNEEFRLYDLLLAVTLSICTIVGLLGNITSLLYFFSTKHDNFSRLIYMLMCSIDICI
jgi:hypothetical protein